MVQDVEAQTQVPSAEPSYLSESSQSSESLRSSLSSSSNSGSDIEDVGVRALHHEDTTPKVRRIRSLRDQILDDNQSILKEENLAKVDLDRHLHREFSIEDALQLKKHRSVTSVKLEDLPERQRRLSTVERVYTNLSTGTVDLPPDGGYGWVCCLCALLILFSTWGNNSAFGVYLAYYIDNDVFPGATRIDFAWIAGLLVFLAQVFAPFAIISERMVGFKLTMSIACAFHFLGYMLASFATKLWQLYLCQSVIVGISYSFLFVPACTIIPNWFLKRRAIASGILCSGTGLGGMVYSLSINAMIQRTGDQRWSLRMVAIVTTITMAVSIFFIKKRNQPPRQKINTKNFIANLGDMFSRKILKAPQLWYITMWFSFALLGYNMTLFSFASSATALGLSQHQASVLTALVNAAQAIGRPTIGVVADSFVGRVNYSMVLNLVVIVLIFAYWLAARSFGALIGCGLCLGFTLGVGNVMNSVLIADAFNVEDFAAAWSILNMVMAFFVLFVEVIALSLRDNSLDNPFLYAQVFAGCTFIVAFLFLIPLREWHIRILLTKRQDETNSELQAISNKEISSIPIEKNDLENLKMKSTNYNMLLARTPHGYLKRASYPVKM
jgi:MFS family permease